MKTKAILRWIQYALFIFGAVALACCAFFLAEEKLFQAYQNRAFEQALQQRRPPAAGLSPSPLYSRRGVRPAPPAGTSAHRSVSGRLEIPSVKLSVMVLADDSPRSLRLGAGTSPAPRCQGNPAMAASPGIATPSSALCAASHETTKSL